MGSAASTAGQRPSRPGRCRLPTPATTATEQKRFQIAGHIRVVGQLRSASQQPCLLQGPAPRCIQLSVAHAAADAGSSVNKDTAFIQPVSILALRVLHQPARHSFLEGFDTSQLRLIVLSTYGLHYNVSVSESLLVIAPIPSAVAVRTHWPDEMKEVE